MVPTRSRKRYAAVAAATAVIIVAVGFTLAGHLLPSSTSRAPRFAQLSAYRCGTRPGAGAVSVRARPSAMGLLPASAALCDRLILRASSVPAGTAIGGTLYVLNRSGHPINLKRRCTPKFAVVLTNRRFPPTAAFPADCPQAPFLLRPGVTKLAVSVSTDYQSCGGQPGSLSPPCRPGSSPMPPLPAGRYRAVLVGDGILALPRAPGVAVILRG